MSSIFLKSINILFKGICFSFAAYLILLQIQNYLRNDDVSSIAFKQLNSNPEDQYPTFTLCFVDKDSSGAIFNPTYLKSTAEISSKEYQTMLLGDDHFDSNIVSVEFEKATMDANEIVSNFLTRTTSGMDMNVWDKMNGSEEYKSNNRNDFPLYISYQDPTQICYTRKADYDNRDSTPTKIMRKYDLVTLNITLIKEQFSDLKALSVLRVYIHNPGQFIRGLGKELMEHKISHIGPEFSNNKIYVTTSQIVVLKKRANAIIPCDQNLFNEDQKLLNEIMKKTGCIPPYWKPLTRLQLPKCNDDVKMKMIANFTANIEKPMSLYDPPCHEMTIVAGAERTHYADKDHLMIKFNYLNEMFLEIANGERFSAQGFLCRIGGFLGMFLGFSLLQIPDLLSSILVVILNKMKKMRICGDQDEKTPI